MVKTVLWGEDRTMNHAAAEREVLAGSLSAAGPDAPTLCTGWTARDLAAHLVVRERRPDTMLGVNGGPLAGWTESVRNRYAQRPFEELVATFRAGPPPLSWARLPGMDARANTAEHFVHAEDVRRGSPGWQPRTLSPGLEQALWGQAVLMGRLRLRRSPVGVVLVVPGGPRRAVARREPAVTLTGSPGELVLYLFGRRGQAQVEVGGSPEALATYRRR